MAKHKDTIKHKVLAFLEKAGAFINEVIHRNHVKIKYTYRGQKCMIVFPGTESDRRAEQNALAQVKRDLREIDDV